jgi:serine/threonine protein kinase
VDVNTVGGYLCLVWPFVEGQTLEKLVEQKSRLLPGVAALFVLQAAEGLRVCHHQGLIHGLLKPANFLVGPNQEIRVLDFGTGALLSEAEGAELIDTMSTANAVTSGLDCRSPENILDVKIRTPAGDQYSLGCVLYFCLTGRYPFAGESAVEKMLAHQVKEPTPIRSLRPEVPQPLVEIVHRLMQKTPEGRYPNLDEVIEAMRRLAVTPEVAGRLLAMDIPELPISAGQIHESVIATQTTAKPSPDLIPDSNPREGPQNDAKVETQFDFEPIAATPAISRPSRNLESSRRIRTLTMVGFFACIGLIIVLLWILLRP